MCLGAMRMYKNLRSIFPDDKGRWAGRMILMKNGPFKDETQDAWVSWVFTGMGAFKQARARVFK